MNAVHLRELIALGITGGVLVRVAEIIDEASNCVTQSNALRNVTSRVTEREKAKVRQQSFRNRKKEQELAREVKANDVTSRNANVTRDVTPTPLSDCVLLTSSFLLSGEPLKEERKKESSGIRARGTRMAPGTLLSDEHRALIVAEGIADPEKLWAEFVDYWSDIPGQRGVKVKWDGTLRNRCRDVIKRGFNGQPTSSNRAYQASGPAPTRDAAVIASLGRTLERRRVARAADRSSDEELFGDAGIAGESAADTPATTGDDEPHRKLALVAASNVRR